MTALARADILRRPHADDRVVVGLATRGRPALVRLLVSRLRRQSLRPGLIVVAYVAPGDVAGLSEAADLSLIACEAGLTRQRNAILESLPSEAEMLVFFDDDFLPHPHWLRAAFAAFAAEPALRCVTGTVLANGVVTGEITPEAALDALALAQPGDGAEDGVSPYGCNMAFRCAGIDALRFDERLPLYGWLEDRDFAARVGGRQARLRAAVGVHLGAAAGRMPDFALGYAQIANPLHLLGRGTMGAGVFLRRVLADLASNALKAPRSGARRRRLAGNGLALLDAALGRLRPERAARFDGPGGLTFPLSGARTGASEREGRMRAVGSFVLGLVLATGAFAAPPERLKGAPATPFYDWTAAVPAPGALLRSEPLPPELELASAAKGERILYSSTDGVDGKTPIVVSGAMFWPKGDAPAGGWPVVAWAHGTVGATAVCAPSFAGRSARDIKYLNAWLDAGFAVVGDRLSGLGPAGGHPYLATRPEAYGVLDAARAAKGREGVGDKVIVVGQSQGAGAAFATAAFQPSYAPDVTILGTVATGLPYFSEQTMTAIAHAGVNDKVVPTLAYNLLLLQTAELTQPGFDPQAYLSDVGKATYALGDVACLGAMESTIVEGRISEKTAFVKSTAGVFQSLFPLIAYPTVALKQPLFVGTGELDRDVPPPMQGALVHDACAAGARVTWRRYAGLDHSGTVNPSLADSLPFVRDLLAGKPAPEGCSNAAGTAP